MEDTATRIILLQVSEMEKTEYKNMNFMNKYAFPEIRIIESSVKNTSKAAKNTA